jgi:hypothetical protein
MTTEEVMEVAKKLGYDINEEDAKIISDTAGDDDNYVTYLIESSCE